MPSVWKWTAVMGGGARSCGSVVLRDGGTTLASRKRGRRAQGKIWQLAAGIMLIRCKRRFGYSGHPQSGTRRGENGGKTRGR